MRKKCTKCNVEKDTKHFYKQSKGLYGCTGECKECRKERTRNYKKRFPDKVAIKDRIYSQKLKSKYGQSHSRRSHIRLAERSIIGFERYAEKKMQTLAACLLNYAIRIKLVDKPSTCTLCKKKKDIQGHHTDYSKPLQVIWVCVECHSKFHENKIT